MDVDEEEERGMLKDAAVEMLDIGGKETDVDALDDAWGCVGTGVSGAE